MYTNSTQTMFLDIKDKLKDSVLQLYDIPGYAQVDITLVNMANYFPLIKDLIETVDPKHICEIGSDQGATTKVLYEYCKEKNAKLSVVDPSLSEDLVSDEIITYHREMSLTYLENEKPADIYFIDGDHNYYTVLNELKLIRDNNSGEKAKLLFIHDVGWPAGVMDMYYDENKIEEKYRHDAIKDLNISAFKSQYISGHQGLPMNDVTVAAKDGGMENGVLPAIEKFLLESTGWKYFSIPSIWGLGALWYGKNSTPEITEKMKQLESDFHKFREFLSILEFNRVILLEEIEKSGEIWKEQVGIIKEQGEVVKEQEEVIKKLHNSSLEQGNIWSDQQNYIEELTKQNEALRLEVNKLKATAKAKKLLPDK